MAQVARLGLGILGYAVGGPIGGLVGSLLGGLLFPPEQKPTKVGPLTVSAPQKGQPLPVLGGTRRVPGYYIWYGNFQTHAPQRGKGGKGLGAGSGRTDATTYSASFALALCEGADPGSTIKLLRIWAGKDVIWNVDGSVGSGLNFTFYDGSAGQAADPELASFTSPQTLGGSQGPATTESFTASGTAPTYTVLNPPIWPNTVLAYYTFTNPVTGLAEQHFLTPTAVATPGQGQFTVNNSTGLVTLGLPPNEINGGASWTGQSVSVQYQQAVGGTVVTVGAIAYPHVCYIAFHSFNLGVQTAPPNFSFEVVRRLGPGISPSGAAVFTAPSPPTSQLTHDDGATWAQMAADPSPGSTLFMKDDNIIYELRDVSVGGARNQFQVYETTDGGATFHTFGNQLNLAAGESVPNAPPGFLRLSDGSFVVLAQQTAVAGITNFVVAYRSTNNCITWVRGTQMGFPAGWVDVEWAAAAITVKEDGTRPGTLYCFVSDGVGVNQGLARSSNFGQSWAMTWNFRTQSGLDVGQGSVQSLFVTTKGTLLCNYQKVFGGAQVVILRSTDGGSTFSSPFADTTSRGLHSNFSGFCQVVNSTPSHGGRVMFYAALQSDDDGATWQAMPNPLFPATISPCDYMWQTLDAVFASGGQVGLFRSPDAGATWTKVITLSAGQYGVMMATKPLGVGAGGAADINPVDFLQDFITNTRYGLGRPASDIDTATFAVTESYVASQALLSSPLLDKSQSGLKHIEEILALYEGFLFTSQGAIKFGVRQPAVATNVFAFGDYTAKELPAVTRPGLRDTKNRVMIEWSSRALDYVAAYAKMDFDDDIIATGERQEARSLRAVCVPAVAQALASRAFLSQSVRKLALTHGLDPRWGLLEPGDIYVAQAPGISAQQVFRIAGIVEDEHWGLRIESVEDPISVAPSPIPSFAVQVPVPPLGPPGPAATANTIGYVAEVPYELSGGALRLAVFGTASGTGWVGADVFVSRDAQTYTFAGSLGRAISGLLRTPVLAGPYQFDQQSVMMDATQSGLSLPATTRDGLHAQSLVLVLGATPSTTAAPGPAANQLVEWLAYQNAVLQASGIYAVDTFLRSLYDSQASPAGAFSPQWASGTNFVLWDPRVYLQIPFGVGDVGSPIYFKFVTHALFGAVFVTTAPTYLSYTPQGIALWPDPPSLVQAQRPDGVLVGGGNGF